MITREEALKIIENHAEWMSTLTKENYALLEPTFREFEHGWTFMVCTRNNLGIFDLHKVSSTIPVKIIDKNTGEIHVMGIFRSLEDYMGIYARRCTAPPTQDS